jgi:hypothetical protein
MFTRYFRIDTFLRRVYGTRPFIEYCLSRGIDFPQGSPDRPRRFRTRDVRRWATAFDRLAADEQERVLVDLWKINDLAHVGKGFEIVSVAQGRLPPPDVPAGAPLLLYYLVQHREFFETFFFHHRIGVTGCWKITAGPVAAGGPIETRKDALRAAIQAFFTANEGTEGYCHIDVQAGAGAYRFDVYVAERLQLLEEFTGNGKHTIRRTRPAFAMVFLYRPADGTLSLKTRHTTREDILELFQLFGRVVLGVELPDDCLRDLFQLDVLKEGHDLLPDDVDMVSARVKALDLEYSAARGLRKVKFDTLATDAPDAMNALLAAHVPGPALLASLRVIRAELQVRMREKGATRNVYVELHRNRCSLDQSPLGDRLRRCLGRWGLCHAPRP